MALKLNFECLRDYNKQSQYHRNQNHTDNYNPSSAYNRTNHTTRHQNDHRPNMQRRASVRKSSTLSIGILSIVDQIYLIFRQNDYRALSFTAIQRQCSDRFGTNIIPIDLTISRFVTNSENMFKITLFADDICRNGFNCKNINCNRIHVIVRDHVCNQQLNMESMRCNNHNCNLVHVHLEFKRLTTLFLEVILLCYRYHRSESNTIKLGGFRISLQQFINTYFEFYKYPPIPNITRIQWKRLIRKYSRYYFDYEQQKDRMRNEYPHFLYLWNTDYANITDWHIIVKYDADFYERRTCYHAVGYVMNVNRYPCNLMPKSFCPYFHLTDSYSNRRNLNDLRNLQKMYPIPGCCWFRTQYELDLEISHVMEGKQDRNTVDVMNMCESETHFHDQWSNMLKQQMHYSSNQYGDNQMDEGFHAAHDGIEIVWNKKEMSALYINPLEIINYLVQLFNGTYRQHIFDIHLPIISKTIVLQYKVYVFEFQYIFRQFSKQFHKLTKLWCFNRKVSFKMMLDQERECRDGLYLILEFENVNMFLSPELLNEWFMNLIINRGVLRHDFTRYMQFVKGDCYLIKHNETLSQSHSHDTAIAYFVDLDPNCHKGHNPNVKGVKLQLNPKSANDIFEFNDANSLFVKYGPCNTYLQHSDRNKQNQSQINYPINPPNEYPLNSNPAITQNINEINEEKCNITGVTHMEVYPKYQYEAQEVRYQSQSTNVTNAFYNCYDASSEEKCIESINIAPECYETQRKYTQHVHEPTKNEKQDDGYVSLAKLIQARHEAYNEKEKIFQEEDDHLNSLCRYCMLEIWNEEHKRKCLFIPKWIQDGDQKPSKELENAMVFVAHDYK